MNLLSWQTLLFLIPMVFGSVLAIGAAFYELGEGGAVEEPARDGGVADGGRMPLTLRLMYGSLCFGGLGLASTFALGGLVSDGAVGRTLLAAAAAAGGTLAVGRWLERTFGSRVRLLETETIDRRDLIGTTGRAVLPVGPAGGLAQVHDRRGNLHQVACRTWAGEPAVPAGAEVLLVEYEDAFYRVTANPADPGLLQQQTATIPRA